MKISDSSWLNLKRSDITSQNGEDGVLAAIFERIGVRNWWCCELGAHDGKTNSNTWDLRHNHGWTGLLIESDASRIEALKGNAAENDIIAHAHVDEFNFERILLQTKIPKSFDLLSIDVDGEDQNLWRAMMHYTPRVVVMEVNSAFLPGVIHKSSISCAVNLAKQKGYELALHTGNCIFVRKEYAKVLHIDAEKWEELFDSSWAQNRVM